jgi:hypothetical protein
MKHLSPALIGKYGPFGVPGARLWVRECWDTSYCTAGDGIQGDVPFYRADYEGDPAKVGWRSSTSMPRRFSRIALEVLDVRAELLGDISEDDIRAEGVTEWRMAVACGWYNAFYDRWNSIYAKKGLGWADNPWVFAGTFKRIET